MLVILLFSMDIIDVVEGYLYIYVNDFFYYVLKIKEY